MKKSYFFLFTLINIAIEYLAAAQQKPNIVFILSDDHSAPFLSCYGDPNVKTPNLDKLAQAGTD